MFLCVSDLCFIPLGSPHFDLRGRQNRHVIMRQLTPTNNKNSSPYEPYRREHGSAVARKTGWKFPLPRLLQTNAALLASPSR